MADTWESVIKLLPDDLGRPLRRIPPSVRETVGEIRLRAGQAVALGIHGRERYLTSDGTCTDNAGGGVYCTAAQLRSVIDRACEQSVYAHEEELCQGFLPAPRGCRIGVAGTAVTERGVVRTYRNVTSLCIRVAGEHRGCAAALAEQLCDGGVYGALVCGEPSSGKTSILRDLLREFAARCLPVAVIDERGELTGDSVPLGCDVLRGVPKPTGITQALRCLSPRVIVFDELGTAAECEAVRAALSCGVPVVASVHCRTPQELYRREGMAALLDSGAFTYVVQLRGVAQAGVIERIWNTEEWRDEMAGTAVAAGRVHGCGIACGV